MNIMTHSGIRSWILALLCLGAYLQIFQFGYVNLDDKTHLIRNPHLNPLTTENVMGVWEKPYKLLYIPVTYTAWALASSIHKDPTFFHAINLLLHILNSSILVYGLLKLLTGNKNGAFAGALIFALHPLQVEPVAWISGLKDVLSGTFSLLAIYTYLQIIKSPQPSRILYPLSTFSFLLAILAKPSAVSVPLLAGVLALFLSRGKVRAILSQMGLWLFIAAPIMWVTGMSQSDSVLQFTVPSWPDRVFIALDAVGFYLLKLVLPINLIVDYGRSPQFMVDSGRLWVTATLSAAAFGVLFAYAYRIRSRSLFLAFLLFLIPLIPVLGFKPFVYQTTSTVADRYLYLSLLGPAFAFAHFKRPFALKRTQATIALTAFPLALLTWFQVSHWRSSETLFTHALKHNPLSWLAHNNLGSVYEERKEYDRALSHYERSVKLFAHMPGYNSIALLYMLKKEPQKALAALYHAIDSGLKQAPIYLNLSVAHQALGEKDKARRAYEVAVHLDPVLAARYPLGGS